MIKENEVIVSDRFSSIYFKEHYNELLKYLKSKYNVSYPALEILFESEDPIEPNKLLRESLDLIDLLLRNDYEMPRAYFFAVFPKDFNDVLSLILGGSSNIKVPLKEGLYELKGGFGYALLLKDGELIRELSEGEEINLGMISIKVFSRSCYDMMEKPLKTLVVFSLLAVRRRAKVKTSSSPTSFIIWRSPSFNREIVV